MGSELEFIELEAATSVLDHVKILLMFFILIVLVWIGTEIHQLKVEVTRPHAGPGQMVVTH